MKKLIIWVLVVVLVGWAAKATISTLNVMVGLDEGVKANWSQVLNQYQRRSDLIPNLVATVKGYAAHEQATFTDVIEARTKATQVTLSVDNLSDAQAMQAFQQSQGALSSALSRLMAVSERYPELKANENFMALQSQLEGMENRITVARKDYIESVKDFNTRIRTIPTKWIVALFSDMEPKASFEIAEEAQIAPQVQF